MLGLPRWLSGKEPACQCRRGTRCKFGPWVRKIPGGGHGHPLQCSCGENPVDRGTWWAMAHGVTKSWTRLEGLSMHSTMYSQPGMRSQCILACQFVDGTFLTSAYNTNCRVSFTSSRRSQRLQVLPQSWAFLHPHMLRSCLLQHLSLLRSGSTWKEE